MTTSTLPERDHRRRSTSLIPRARRWDVCLGISAVTTRGTSVHWGYSSVISQARHCDPSVVIEASATEGKPAAVTREHHGVRRPGNHGILDNSCLHTLVHVFIFRWNLHAV